MRRDIYIYKTVFEMDIGRGGGCFGSRFVNFCYIDISESVVCIFQVLII